MTNLYLLSRKDRVGYDEYSAKLIRATSEAQARRIADENVGDEGRIWNIFALVSCTIVKPDGACDVIMESYHAG